VFQQIQRRFSRADWGLSAFLAVTWGASFLFIAIAIDDLDPAVVPFGRALIGTMALACFPNVWRSIPRRHWTRIAVLGLVWMTIPFLLFPLAERSVTSGVAGMINGGLPVVMAFVTAIWVRRVPSKQRIAAVLLGFTGISVIALPAIREVSTTGGAVADVRGIFYLLAAVTCYACGANIARPLQSNYPPANLLMHVQFAATLWALPFAIGGLERSTFSWSSIGALVALGVLGTGVAFVAFGTLLERTGISRAMIPTYFTPIIGLVLGATFRGERVASLSLLGMCIVITSAWMTSKPDELDVTLSMTPKSE